jgi:hypothetical protein
MNEENTVISKLLLLRRSIFPDDPCGCEKGKVAGQWTVR